MDTTPRPLGWWTISGEALLDLLHRAHNGDDPDLLYAEEYANCDREDFGTERTWTPEDGPVLPPVPDLEALGTARRFEEQCPRCQQDRHVCPGCGSPADHEGRVRGEHDPTCVAHEMAATTTLRWCAAHDEPARQQAKHCALGEPIECDIETVDEAATRCLGQCGRHTLAYFMDGPHGPGPYCGWCESPPF